MPLSDEDVGLASSPQLMPAGLSDVDVGIDPYIPEQDQPLSGLKGVGAAAISGINSLVPSILGMPVDFATQLSNLGIAGYGMGKHFIGGTPGHQLPETLGPQTLGSQWFQNKISNLLGGDPFAPPDPTDPMQQKAQMTGAITGSALLSPASGMKQVAANVGRSIPASIGANVAQEMFPDQPLAPLAGMMAGSAALPALAATGKSMIKPASAAAKKAMDAGYKLLPSRVTGSRKQDFIQSASGTVPTKQMMSTHNQEVTNGLVRREFGLPDDAPINFDTLERVRADAGTVYQKLGSYGRIKADNTYINEIRKIARPSAVAKSFPGAEKKDIVAQVKKFARKEMDSDSVVAAIKELRKDASAGINAQDPQIQAMARANRKVADALEGLLERSLQKVDPNIVPEFKAARQTIAKTYSVEKALGKGGDNVDARKLATQLVKGKPLSGNLKTIAEFGKNFDEVAQPNPPQTTNFRPMDFVLGLVGAAGYDRKLIALMLARPAMRKMITSNTYQNALKNIDPAKLEEIARMPKNQQSGAMAYMLQELNKETQATQPQQ